MVSHKLKYSLMLIKASKNSAPNESKNARVIGSTTRWAKYAPSMNKAEDENTKGRAKRFSFRYRPGATNIHNCQKMTGADKKMPV